MSKIENIENRVNEILMQETPTLAEMRRLMLEIDEQSIQIITRRLAWMSAAGCKVLEKN